MLLLYSVQTKYLERSHVCVCMVNIICDVDAGLTQPQPGGAGLGPVLVRAVP
jgi:hypothetical protein